MSGGRSNILLLASAAEMRRALEQITEQLSLPGGLPPRRLADEVAARYKAQSCVAIELGAQLVRLMECAERMKEALNAQPPDVQALMAALGDVAQVGESILSPSPTLNIYQVHAARIGVCEAAEAFVAHCTSSATALRMSEAAFKLRGEALAAHLRLAVGRLALERFRPAAEPDLVLLDMEPS